jgi:methylated-DNA-[protein]-cysteine S-methyltransferase
MSLLKMHVEAPEGPLTLLSNRRALVGVYFAGHKPGGPPPAETSSDDDILIQARKELDAYFAGRRRNFETPLALRGTPFQLAVWKRLQAIAFGDTATYGAIAADVGDVRAVRAAAQAIARNPISIIVPCHRVIGADGRLTGYAGGLDWKRRLLALEQGGRLSLS